MEGCRVEMSLLRGGLAGGESPREQHHSPRKAKALTVGVLHKNLEVLSMNRDKDIVGCFPLTQSTQPEVRASD